MSAMSATESVTRWFHTLKSGDDQIAQQIWQQYSDALLKIARARVGSTPAFDEEDVVQSVFRTLFRRAANGQFDQLESRAELWRLLVKITIRKAINRWQHERRQKRGGDHVHCESELMRGADGQPLRLADFPDAGVPPEVVAMLAEQHGYLMAKLRDDTLRAIARWKMDGLVNADIAKRLNISVRSVERKLRLIRDEWHGELGS